jgi:5-methylcytosine-specific restriction protein A
VARRESKKIIDFQYGLDLHTNRSVVRLMPAALPRPCRYPGCGVVNDPPNADGYCSTHRREAAWGGRAKGSAHRRGYGVAWRRLRGDVLAREPLCRACHAAGRVTVATEVDHIVPKARGGGDDQGNLQPLCAACHATKSAAEGAQRP